MEPASWEDRPDVAERGAAALAGVAALVLAVTHGAKTARLSDLYGADTVTGYWLVHLGPAVVAVAGLLALAVSCWRTAVHRGWLALAYLAGAVALVSGVVLPPSPELQASLLGAHVVVDGRGAEQWALAGQAAAGAAFALLLLAVAVRRLVRPGRRAAVYGVAAAAVVTCAATATLWASYLSFVTPPSCGCPW
ncbi:hypothetical protein Lfu02_62420 [Longispora fulva]|nr:hypothetical protein Lfu02_62420 [Longispora fulva]